MKEIGFKGNKTVYIAGPMTGMPLFNYPKFFAMEGLLIRFNHCQVMNPAAQECGLDYKECMRRACVNVARSDVILLLDGWEKSKGAKFEYEIAKKIGLLIVTEKDYFMELQKFLKEENPMHKIGELK